MMRKALQKILLGTVLAAVITVANAMSLSQAVEKVRRETGGKVLSAQTKVQKDREIHLVKVLTQDGRVRTVRVPGNTVKPRRPR